jgi:hypothetical protein
LTRISPLWFVPLLAACVKPPEAPDKLEELCGFIYEHFRDEDPAALESAVTKLDTWLTDNFAATQEGYTVDDLDDNAVAPLDAPKVDISNLAGAAVVTDIDHSVYALTKTILTTDPRVVYNSTYTLYDREWITDIDCFVEGFCEEARAYTHSVSDWPLNMTVGVHLYQDYRWVDGELGESMIQRTWLDGPAEVTGFNLSVDAQYYMAVNIPQEDGGLHRLQAMWVVAEIGDASVPEAAALDLVIDSMRGEDVTLTYYLDSQEFIEEEGRGGQFKGGSCSHAPVGAGLGVSLAGLLLARRRRAKA